MAEKNSLFFRFAKHASSMSGHPRAFGLAAGLIAVWLITGPLFHFSDTWQLVVNTLTTIITFLMVFLIQNTQNRDILAVHLKLNELIRSVQGAHNSLMEIENLSDEELKLIDEKYKRLAQEIDREVRKGKGDIGSPEISQRPPQKAHPRHKS